MEKKKFFYGWWMVFVGFMLMFTIYSIVYNCSSLFMKPISTDLDASRASVSVYYTVMTLISIPAGLVVSKIYDKKDVKIPLAVLCVFVGGGFMLFSIAQSIMQFYLFAAIVGIGLSGTCGLAISLVLNNWFIKRKGLAMGLAFIGSGVGGTVLSQIANYLINTMGWRPTYLIMGIITIALTVPFVLIFVTKDPAKKGYKPYGYDEIVKSDNAPGEVITDTDSPKLGKSIRSAQFWLYFIGFAFLAMVMSAVKLHLTAYLTDLNYSLTFAANILTLTVALLIPGKPLIGMIFDKFGSRKAILISGMAMTVAILCLIGGAKITFLPIVFGVVYGLGSTVITVGAPLFVNDLFEKGNFAMLFTLSGLGAGVGGAFGPTIIGLIYDNTGSYYMGWVFCAVCFALATLFIWWSLRVAAKKNIKNY